MRSLLAALGLLVLAGAGALAQEPGPPVFLDRLQGDLARALAEADAAARAGDFADAAGRYQALIDIAAEGGRDHLVEVRPAEGGIARAGAIDPERRGDPLYVSLPVVLRGRLAALPPAGLRAYRDLVSGRASALAARAIAARDRDALERVVARFLFASGGVDAARALGDLYFESGDLCGALSTYRLGAEVPDGAPALAERIEAARARLAAAPAVAARAPVPAGTTETAAALARSPPRRLELAAEGESPGAAAALNSAPVPIPGGAVVVRPGYAVVLRPIGATRTAAPAGGILPARARPIGISSAGPFALGGEARASILAVAIEHSRFLDGSGAEDLEAMRRRNLPLPPPGAFSRPASETGRGGLSGFAYDLFAFDIGRDCRLVFTTAETSAFGADGAWLATVEWTSVPALGPGLVFGAATGRSGEPEVFAAAFDCTIPARLRWRTFLCARAFVPGEGHGDGIPIQPALARAGAMIVVDSGIGVLAGIDAHRGEIVWATGPDAGLERAPDFERTGPAAARRLVEIPPRIGSEEPTARPLVVEREGEPPLAVFAPRPDGRLVALDSRTGEVVWRAAAESAIAPVATVAGRLAVVEDGALALIDPATGKRCAPPLPLPPPSVARPSEVARVLGRGAAMGDLVAIPLAGSLFLVRAVRVGAGVLLEPERAIPLATDSRMEAVVAGGALLLAGDRGVLVYRLDAGGGPRSARERREDALSIAAVYGFEADEAFARALDEAAGGAAGPPAAVAGDERPGTDEEARSTFTIERTATEVRALPAGKPRGRARVVLVLDRATRSLRASVEPSPGD